MLLRMGTSCRVVNKVTEPSGSTQYRKFPDYRTLSFSGRTSLHPLLSYIRTVSFTHQHPSISYTYCSKSYLPAVLLRQHELSYGSWTDRMRWTAFCTCHIGIHLLHPKLLCLKHKYFLISILYPEYTGRMSLQHISKFMRLRDVTSQKTEIFKVRSALKYVCIFMYLWCLCNNAIRSSDHLALSSAAIPLYTDPNTTWSFRNWFPFCPGVNGLEVPTLFRWIARAILCIRQLMRDLAILMHVAKTGFCQQDITENIPKKTWKDFFFDFLAPEDGNVRLSQNDGVELPINTAWNPRRAQVSMWENYLVDE